MNIFRKHTSSNLETLWEDFIAGNMSSFRCIYTQHYQNLYTFGLRYLNSDDTEDAIQNLFLYILQHRKSFSKIKSVKAYLFISYRNQIFKIRKTKNLSFVQIDIESIVGEQISSTKEKIIGELLIFIKKLSPREKEIINLKYFQDYKNIEIANSLNIEYQTVRNILHNAIKKLRKLNYQISDLK
jgi:RNA polymerase sigma factor (sigma-70 family)